MPAIRIMVGRFEDAQEASTSERPSGVGYEAINAVVPYTENVAGEAAVSDLTALLADALTELVWRKRQEADPSYRPRPTEPITLADLWPNAHA